MIGDERFRSSGESGIISTRKLVAIHLIRAEQTISHVLDPLPLDFSDFTPVRCTLTQYLPYLEPDHDRQVKLFISYVQPLPSIRTVRTHLFKNSFHPPNYSK